MELHQNFASDNSAQKVLRKAGLGGIMLASSTKAFAASAPGAWEFVKAAANWARFNSTALESILNPILKSGLLSQPSTYTTTSSDGIWTFRLTVDVNVSHSATAYSSTQSFKHRFEIWRTSDGAKGLELFFNSADTLKESPALLFFRIKIMADSSYDGADIVTESYISGALNQRRQTYTFTGGSFDESGVLSKGRVIVEQMTEGVSLHVKAVLAVTAASNFCTNITDPKYYSLAFVQKTDLASDYEVTAKFGLKVSDVDNTGNLCSTANASNYGVFTETDGFVSQGNSSAPAGFPSVAEVNSLYTELGTTGGGTYEDTSLAAINSWNISMKSLAAP